MTYMLHPEQMNLSEKLNPQIIQANNKPIDAFGIISLYIFSGYLAKQKERICETIKSALEIFIRGLKLA